MASSPTMLPEERIQRLDKLKDLDKLKRADLKALCKEFKLKGYSQAKRDDLIAKLIQYRETLNPSGEASIAPSAPQQHQPSQSYSATPSVPPSTFPTPAGQLPSFNDGIATSASALPTFIDTPSSAASYTALITPTAPPLQIDNVQGSGLVSNRCDADAYPPLSSSPRLPSSPLLAYSISSSRTIASRGSTIKTNTLPSISNKEISQQRREERSQAATSLKDVAAKQRGAKRTAGGAGIDAGKLPAKRVSTSHETATSSSISTNTLQLHDMFTPTIALNSGFAGSIRTTGQTTISSSSAKSSTNQSLNASHPKSTFHPSLSEASSSGSPDSRQTDRILQSAIPTSIVPPPIQAIFPPLNAATTIQKGTDVQSNKTIVTTSSGPVKPVRARNPKMAPLKRSVVPSLGQPATTPSPAPKIPHLPLGTVPLASSPHIVPAKGKTMSTQKKKLTRNFVAPAYKPPSTRPPDQSKLADPQASCQEEPLLCGPVPETSSAQDIIKSKQEAIARMRKSWLNRFYQQVAKGRKDTLLPDPNLGSGSRSPAGLPGMAPEFVYAATTGPEQLDVAIVFVIARLHTRIQMNDWEAIVKDEQVVSVKRSGGGVCKVSTRTQPQGQARKFGYATTAKVETDSYFVIGDTGEMIGKGEEDKLRPDWQHLLAEGRNDGGKPLIGMLRTKDELAYPRGIAAVWTKLAEKDFAFMEEYRMAEKYVLSNVMPNSYSGEYQSALQMDATWTGQGRLSAQPRRAQVNLYLPESHQVECVAFTSSSRTSSKALHPSIMIVKRKSSEDFALRETGQIIGNCEESGVVMVWQCLLGCDAAGIGLSEMEAKQISEQFWTGLEEG